MQKGPAPAVQALFAAALRQHQAGQFDDAERLYRQVLQAAPRHADALHFRGVLAHQTGRHEAAIDLIDKAIAQNPRIATFHHNRGIVLAEQGKHATAAAAFRRAIALNPQFAEGHFNLGVSLQNSREWEKAAASYAQAIVLNSGHATAHTNLAMVRSEQARLDEAVALFAQALRLDPTQAQAHNGLGNIYKEQGKLGEAAACYERAVALDPAFTEAVDNLGIVLLESGDLSGALRYFDDALAGRPNHAPAHRHRGYVLKELGHTADAVAAYRSALALVPEAAEAHIGLAIAAIPLVPDTSAASMAAIPVFSQRLDELTSWVGAKPEKLAGAVGRNLPFHLAYRPSDSLQALSRFGDLMSDAAAIQWPAAVQIARATRPTRTRFRLGIVSGHICRHPVWDIVLRGILQHVDRKLVELHVYYTATTVDTETEWAREHCERFVQGPKPTASWIDEIARDLPDALFYPEVGMDAATYALAALRLAPLQIAGWGHPITTGLPTIDIYVTGDLLESSTAESHYRERLVRLPGTGVCTSTPSGCVKPWSAPSRTSNSVRFALCQQPIKFDPQDDAMYAQIARAVGPSEFWLAAPDRLGWSGARLHARLQAEFRAHGLDPAAHLHIMPWLPPDEFLGFLDEMDVYLDCPAFSGYTTAWAAIHRGLPIVTQEGTYLRQRLAAGALRQIADSGGSQGIAASRGDYISTAVRWTDERRHQPHTWAARRTALRIAAVRLDDNRAAVSAFEHVLGLRA